MEKYLLVFHSTSTQSTESQARVIDEAGTLCKHDEEKTFKWNSYEMNSPSAFHRFIIIQSEVQKQEKELTVA